jgi:glutamate dehydrogenase (NAD(P)+)
MVNYDQFGPEYLVKVYDSDLKMQGFLAIDNTWLGPGKGGLRMTADVTEEEIWRLARTMTWKNALAGIPFGGAKAGIVWSGGSKELKKKFVSSFASRIKHFVPKLYVSGPDVSTGEEEMRWFAEATGKWQAATGKPADLCMVRRNKRWCGLPHELGSTGFGVAQATEVAAQLAGINLKKATVAIHGFGNVGSFTYRYLREMGAKIIALADVSACLFSEEGFDDNRLEEIVRKKGNLSDYPSLKKLKPEDFWQIKTDILIPASVTDVINQKNKDKIQAKLIVEAANIPMPEEIEEELFTRGILIVPDLIANAGGVISSYAEFRGYDPDKAFLVIKRKIRSRVRQILGESLKEKTNPRKIALQLAQKILFLKRAHKL